MAEGKKVMKAKEFYELMIKQCEMCAGMLAGKAGLYAHGGDRLSNFKDGAGFNGEVPEKTAWGMVIKHIIALKDYINTLNNQKALYPKAEWIEKITDIINYMIIIRALLEERFESIDNGYGQRNNESESGGNGMVQPRVEKSEIRGDVSDKPK